MAGANARRSVARAEDGESAGVDAHVQKHGAEEEDQQVPMMDDQKQGAEDGYQQELTFDDQKCCDEDGGLAGADARRSEALRPRWEICRR